jgi:hypothetical protein
LALDRGDLRQVGSAAISERGAIAASEIEFIRISAVYENFPKKRGAVSIEARGVRRVHRTSETIPKERKQRTP